MTPNRPRSRTFTLGLIAALLLPLAILGTRLGLWPFRLAFLLIIASAVLAIVTVGIVVFSYLRDPQWKAVSQGKKGALLLALVPLVFLLNPLYRVVTYPVIHDVTTDWLDPPAFVEVSALRQNSDHSTQYQGEAIAALQREAYPDLQSLVLNSQPEHVHRQVRQVLEEMGLDVIADEPEQGRLEAVAVTGLFGFKDDVVVRIRPEGEGARIDVRSMSRIGRSDLGTNARRVREILQALKSDLV